MDLKKFNYPMFSTTGREKEILRMVELATIHQTNFKGVCINIFKLVEADKVTQIECLGLYDKIRMAIGHRIMYLDSHLFIPDYSLNREVRRLLRRIWITKLLNYKG